ncbi:hypothetical protein MUP79_09530 [Candidatus Bathyarchaeota archaeon]|jgi:hypothetical protein|nr:hypothetical protein [Candidatus Bathyarchaeota archaeon]
MSGLKGKLGSILPYAQALGFVSFDWCRRLCKVLEWVIDILIYAVGLFSQMFFL